jgi:hypothetical protein
VRVLWRKKENMNSKAILYEIEKKEEMVYSLNYKLSFLIFSAKNEKILYIW